MDFRIITSPSEGTKRVLKRRIGLESKEALEVADTIGLVQGKLIDMIYAIDIAEKAAGVVVEDIKGSCPQHLISIAVIGDMTSVEAALVEIKTKLKIKEVRGL